MHMQSVPVPAGLPSLREGQGTRLISYRLLVLIIIYYGLHNIPFIIQKRMYTHSSIICQGIYDLATHRVYIYIYGVVQLKSLSDNAAMQCKHIASYNTSW